MGSTTLSTPLLAVNTFDMKKGYPPAHYTTPRRVPQAADASKSWLADSAFIMDKQYYEAQTTLKRVPQADASKLWLSGSAFVVNKQYYEAHIPHTEPGPQADPSKSWLAANAFIMERKYNKNRKSMKVPQGDPSKSWLAASYYKKTPTKSYAGGRAVKVGTI